ncbi:MAG: glucose-6-phosphate isomerase [Clostridia bacterium]|nr:glucose-6-phosphate isomerase [Clostridia bacterium]
MALIKFDDARTAKYIDPSVKKECMELAGSAREVLRSGTGEGSDFLGWLRLPFDYDREEYSRIKAAARKIRSDSEVLVVIGIGGSYLGARAVIDALTEAFPKENSGTKVVFAGNSVSPVYLSSLVEFVKDRDFSVNVISKSGTTTEPAVTFRVFRKLLEDKYGEEGAARRIYATTDKARGALKSLADAKGYETFVIPDDVGGRFSVLTPVGLLPIAAAGIDTDSLIGGARAEAEFLDKAEGLQNPALQYAAVRNILYGSGRAVEILENYEPGLHFITEWWKQLFGESEGKQGKGIFPAGCDFTTDLHSMGQYIQEGPRIMFETVLTVEDPVKDVTLEATGDDLDGLNYLAGRTMDFVNKQAAEGTAMAHYDGDVPVLKISFDALTPECIGALLYFFEYSCGVSGYMLGVNPFNQPGVEAYKKNMFRLLGKP